MLFIFRWILVEARGLLVRPGGTCPEHCVRCVVKMDNEEIFNTSVAAKTPNPYFGEDLHFELQKNFRLLSFYLFDHYSGRAARPLGRVTFRKEDIAKYSDQERWFNLQPLHGTSDVIVSLTPCLILLLNCSLFQGKVCLEISCERLNQEGDRHEAMYRLKVRMVDVCDLLLPASRKTEVYALAHVQWEATGLCIATEKLHACRQQDSKQRENAAYFDLPFLNTEVGQKRDEHEQNVCAGHNGKGSLFLRLSVWHDLPRSSSTFFHGEVRLPLMCPNQFDESKLAWYYLKPRLRGSERTSRAQGGEESTRTVDTHGSLKLQLRYTVDHVLCSSHYNELWTLLLHSLNVQPFRASVLALISYLPKSESDRIVLPLVRTFVHSNHVKPFVCVLCSEEILQCQDVNTLFRNCSFASRCIFELMKLVGSQYLVATLKPCLDKIFLERKSCEVDPDRITPGQSLTDNSRNLIIYAESMIIRIVDSSNHCPQLLRDIFKVIRDVTAKYYPNRVDVQWLVLSSFLVMRFFAAALLNPKSFGLRQDLPDSNVSRTLALITKVIQRLSNFVVCGRKLSDKEAFMVPIWERFSDERHRIAFVKVYFFDRISCAGSESSTTCDSVTVLKEGLLYECKDVRSDCLGRTCSSSKARHCYLTENEFYWCKQKGKRFFEDLYFLKNYLDSTRLGQLYLTEVVLIQPAERKNRGRRVSDIAASAYCLQELEVALMKKTCQRQWLNIQQASDCSQLFEIDAEQQLENIHLTLLRYIETFRSWKDFFENQRSTLPQELPLLQLFNEPTIRQVTLQSLQSILCCTYTLEEKHSLALVNHFKQVKYGSKDLPIGDDNYLLLRSRLRKYAAAAAAASWRDEADKPITTSAYVHGSVLPVEQTTGSAG
ncbi:ras gtpase activating protein gap; gtpase activat or protein for ras gtpase [Trichuris trichiura]|uniref:Ras gtpase activating protein gap gtpase activat or protein for ras gtpase n=1 Tax=Trichuris trichiura TaxID=36087 RepID=A0A077Z4Q8_TRITR|nr:ras gtpase activating protein gap; gtpase activat or protein for ras gtpase [Trichuris trichiura]